LLVLLFILLWSTDIVGIVTILLVLLDLPDSQMMECRSDISRLDAYQKNEKS
jgi:hypothetical protein